MGDDILGAAVEDQFGASVALSADGLTVVGGAPYNNENGEDAGHVRMFRYE